MAEHELLSNTKLRKITFDGNKKIETEIFELYSITLRKKHQDKKFRWTVNKSTEEIFHLVSALKPFRFMIPLEKSLVSKRVFLNLASSNDRIVHLKNFFSFIVSQPIPSPALLEFLEISITSFDYSEKNKEGYVYKYGSGRRTNQKRCFNFCNKIFGKKKMWLRVFKDGIEYSRTNESTAVVEVIHFCKEFKVEYGWNETEFICGVNISTSQHKFLFLTENLRVRDEFVDAIKNNFRESDFNIGNIRYNSSFIQREMTGAKWYVDGCEFYSDVCDNLRKARVAVCITDWWLSPELYLKRPIEAFGDCKLIDILGEIADKGVQVYILLYKELTFTIALNSLYSKRTLQNRSPNIKVIRHPSMGIRGGEFLWSHHSKIVCIDNLIAFIGGLDLCYGRWDTNSHKLIDLEGQIWPGIDYSNVRVADFINVDLWTADSLDRKKIPRMPWHDIAVSVTGVVVKDVWNHFMQLWNHIIKDITSKHDKKNVINLANTISDTGRVLEPDPSILNDQQALKTSARFKQLIQKIDVNEGGEELQGIKQRFYTKRLTQPATDFVSPQQMGGSSKKFDLLGLMKHYIEKNSFLKPYPDQSIDLNDVNTSQRLALKQAEEEKDEFETDFSFTANLEHMNNLKELAKRSSNDYLNKSSKQNISCQIVRSAGLWSMGRKVTEDSIHNAYQSLIIEAKSFIYIENQFFISNSAGKPVMNTIAEVLIKRIRKAIMCSEDFRVIVMIPLLPAFEGSVDDPTAAVLRVQLHYEYKTICRGKKSILSQLKELTPNPEKYIKFFSLRTHDKLQGQPVSEMIYIHSKLMIVDDTTVIVGSANINDRSLLGDRDAEICLVITDRETHKVKYGDHFVNCSKFAYSFRMSIFKEHSGCETLSNIENPFSDEFYAEWDKQASENTKAYREIFRCYPDDKILTLPGVKLFMEKAKLHKYDKYSKKIKGNIVEFPLNFLKDEDLNIKVKQKEYLLPNITFT